MSSVASGSWASASMTRWWPLRSIRWPTERRTGRVELQLPTQALPIERTEKPEIDPVAQDVQPVVGDAELDQNIFQRLAHRDRRVGTPGSPADHRPRQPEVRDEVEIRTPCGDGQRLAETACEQGRGNAIGIIIMGVDEIEAVSLPLQPPHLGHHRQVEQERLQPHADLRDDEIAGDG